MIFFPLHIIVLGIVDLLIFIISSDPGSISEKNTYNVYLLGT